MKTKDPITEWINDLRTGDADAAAHLWGQFSKRVEEVARLRLDGVTRRVYDEQDAANSAFYCLCRGIAEGRFGEVGDRDNFWRLLAVIASRKVVSQQRATHAQKRGEGQVRGDSVFIDQGLQASDVAVGKEPTPEFAAELESTSEAMLAMLADVGLREVALLKFEGFSNTDVCLLYTSPSPRDRTRSRMPSSA